MTDPLSYDQWLLWLAETCEAHADDPPPRPAVALDMIDRLDRAGEDEAWCNRMRLKYGTENE